LLNCIQPIGPSFLAIIRSVLVFMGFSCWTCFKIKSARHRRFRADPLARNDDPWFKRSFGRCGLHPAFEHRLEIRAGTLRFEPGGFGCVAKAEIAVDQEP